MATHEKSWRKCGRKSRSCERESLVLSELPPTNEKPKPPPIKFTVTPVSEGSIQNGDASKHRKKEGDGGKEEGMVRLKVPKTYSTESETYNDTLTQTSITKLLANKFKTYRTCKYDTNGSGLQEKTEENLSRHGSTQNLNSKYESQDYEECENSLFLKDQENFKSPRIHRKWLARWLVMLLIGIGTALVAVAIEYAISNGCKYKFTLLQILIDQCESGPCMVIPLLVWVLINVFLVLLGSSLVTLLEPQAAGSGVPQVKCYLNGVKIPGLLTLRALIAKTVGVVLSVTGGLACGKEGPMIHSGAIVAAGVSQGRSRLLNFDFKIFEYLRSDTEKRDFVSGGAAAGVSSAFGAPVGGLLFSLEEGASFWNQALTWRIVFASMTATFLVNILLSAIHGHPADLSNPGLITFGQFSHIRYYLSEIPIFLAMAVFGGLSGAFFNMINGKLIIFRKRFIYKKWCKITEAVTVAAFSASFSFLLICLFRECSPSQKSYAHGLRVQLFRIDGKLPLGTGEKLTVSGYRKVINGLRVQMGCSDGHHNILSSLFFRTPEEAIIAVLHDNVESYSMVSLVLFVGMYFFLACWTCGLSVSAGVFIPSLLLGASWGRLIGMGVLRTFPNMDNNIGKYALIGAACQLGGTVRMTISLTVILLECTGNITFGLPIVMSLIIAKWVGDLFNEGLYDLHIHMMGIPLLPWEPPEMSYEITAKQVMARPVFCMRKLETVRNILEVLEEYPHSGFPVVDDEGTETGKGDQQDKQTYGKCKGLILRSQLSLLLKHKMFLPTVREKRSIKLEDFRDAYPKHISVLDVHITEEEKKYTLDLEPYMHPTPYTVPMSCSLPRMFRLFRGLGLRHLIVVSANNEVVGMVTRKDLAKYRLKSKGGSLQVQELNIQEDS